MSNRNRNYRSYGHSMGPLYCSGPAINSPLNHYMDRVSTPARDSINSPLNHYMDRVSTPARDSINSYCPIPERLPYARKRDLVNEYRPVQGYRRISTIQEEERARIMAIRRQTREDEERNRRLMAEHLRTLEIRRENERTEQLRRQREQTTVSREDNSANNRNNPGFQLNSRISRIDPQIRRENTAPSSFTWDEFLLEITRPPPQENARTLREQNIENTESIENDVNAKKLYDKNIESVREIAKYLPEDPCSVCYDDEPENMLIMVCCKQYFCFACISAWWKEKRTCPSCRTKDPVFLEVSGKEKMPHELCRRKELEPDNL